VLGGTIERELSIITDIIGQVPVVGFYSYGEIGNVSSSIQKRSAPIPMFQNASITLIGVGE
jgi:small ligand-binding sensory domain FIST